MTEPADFLSTLKRMSDEDLATFEDYAQQNIVDTFDGTECQWASFSLRCIAEIRVHRKQAEAIARLVEAHRTLLDVLAEKEELPEDATGQQRYEMALKEEAAWRAGYDALAALEKP